jgi:alpha-galactosidase
MMNILDQSGFTASRSEKINGGLRLSGPRVTINLPTAPIRYFIHGWQSWSLTAWVETDRRIVPQRPALLQPMQTDPVYVREKRLNGSWLGAVELPDGQIIFLGALGLDAHVLLDGQTLTGWYESGDGDWFLTAGEENDVFARYTQLLGERLGRGAVKEPYRVWCSWYSLYKEIQEDQLLKILNDLGDLPFDVFQIDDGWQVGIGDWEPNAKFSSGMDSLAARIHATGRKAGLWLAPLLIVPSSSIYCEHRDWLLHGENGKLISAGFNWGEPLYALDTTHPEALVWLADLMKKVCGWGYEYAKLDFLYAGALPGKRKVDMPREAAYRNGLKVIREALGNAYFLSCGAPIIPSIGLCDAIRIGTDVGGYWFSKRDDNLLQNFTTPGGRNALRTTLNRLWLQPLVHTDPDVAYFCSRMNTLTAEQKGLLQDLARISNFKATSDVPAWLTDDEQAALRKFLESDAHIERTGRTAFRVDDRVVDFSPHIGLPSEPGPFTNALGAVTGALASAHWVMNTFEKFETKSMKKALKKNPV